jgi:hypothetical protein
MAGRRRFFEGVVIRLFDLYRLVARIGVVAPRAGVVLRSRNQPLVRRVQLVPHPARAAPESCSRGVALVKSPALSSGLEAPDVPVVAVSAGTDCVTVRTTSSPPPQAKAARHPASPATAKTPSRNRTARAYYCQRRTPRPAAMPLSRARAGGRRRVTPVINVLGERDSMKSFTRSAADGGVSSGVGNQPLAPLRPSVLLQPGHKGLSLRVVPQPLQKLPPLS